MAVRFQPTAESRSTSAGSHESEEPRQLTSACALASVNARLPEYEYPVPKGFVVKNTFIEAQAGRPMSLDEFYEERRIHSCPGAPPVPEDSDDHKKAPEPEPLRRAITTGAQAFMTTVASATSFWPKPQQGVAVAPAEKSNAAPSTEDFGAQREPRVLVLSDALPGATLGLNEVPTMGSAGHKIGSCKPCAFFYTRGCENGYSCPFCHLCGPDEKRRRQKEKQSACRAVRLERRQVRL